jgi:5-formyltetrahydrofolate cyclo-ligase
MTKSEIRKMALQERKMLSKEALRALSMGLLEQFALMDFSGVEVVHVFLPMERKAEPDTFLLIDWLAQNYPGVCIIVPRADFGSSLMTNYVYRGAEGLAANFYGILEPVDGEIYVGKVDMVLIPLLAFDLRGYRVGYGKGFYDRFLEGLETKKVGISLFGPVEEIADVNAFDVRMDVCVTPGRVYKFS